MVIFPIDCFIFHVTKTDFLQFLRPEHMICSYRDPWLMDGKDSKHNRRVRGFFSPYVLIVLQTEMTAGSKHRYQTKQFYNLFTMGINCIVLKEIQSWDRPATRPSQSRRRNQGDRGQSRASRGGGRLRATAGAHPGAPGTRNGSPGSLQPLGTRCKDLL